MTAARLDFIVIRSFVGAELQRCMIMLIVVSKVEMTESQ